MRLPLGVTLESRDGTVSKDAKVVNGIVEVSGDNPVVRKRPGLADLGQVNGTNGTAQLLYSWNGINVIIGDTLYRGTLQNIFSSPTSTTSISPTNTGLRFDAQEVGPSASTQYLMIKNKTQAWVIDRAGTKTGISFPATLGSGTYPVLSLTRSGTTATATFATDPGFNVGDTMTIAGAGQSAYNGAQTVTAVTPGASNPGVDIDLTLTRSGTTVTATTISGTAHGLTNGSSYAISGAAQSAYNGTYTVTVTTATQFTYTITTTDPTAYTHAWNPSDKGSGVTLSNSDQTATMTATGSTAVRATTGVTSGLNVYEATVTSISGSGSSAATVFIGFADGSMPLTDTVGADGNGWGYSSDGGIWNGGTSSGTFDSIAGFSVGDVIGVVFDLASGAITVYNNGVVQGTLSGISAGTWYPAVSVQGGSAVIDANFSGSLAYTYGSPASPATGSPVVSKPASTTSATVSYTVSGSPTTPATGTITAQGVGGMVPGIAYIDGYFFVMDTNGVLWASAIDDPTSWNALNFTTVEKENGAGKGVAKSVNYLVAFKEWSTEFYYNAANQTGFPFSPVDNGFTNIGCPAGESIAKVDGNLVWLAQVKERGRSVYMMAGMQQQKISTPDIERILNIDDLATVYAYALKISGHSLYVLSLVTSNITLVYDFSSQVWTQWTTATVGSTHAITSITRTGSTATVTTSAAHGLSDGDPVKLSGSTQAEYNGVFQISYVSTTVFTITVTGTPASPATGTPLYQTYTETYFNFTKYADHLSVDLVLHATNGNLFQISRTSYRDGTGANNTGIPINLFIRTSRMDGGSTETKINSRLTVIADKVDDIAMLRWSDDDCQTFTAYRPVDLSLDRPSLRRNGNFRRRTIEFRYTGNLVPRIQSLELEIPQ